MEVYRKHYIQTKDKKTSTDGLSKNINTPFSPAVLPLLFILSSSSLYASNPALSSNFSASFFHFQRQPSIQDAQPDDQRRCVPHPVLSGKVSPPLLWVRFWNMLWHFRLSKQAQSGHNASASSFAARAQSAGDRNANASSNSQSNNSQQSKTSK